MAATGVFSGTFANATTPAFRRSMINQTKKSDPFSFDITKSPLYQQSQNTASNFMAGQVPEFDIQANITRDAQKVAQSQEAKAKREQLMGFGMRDTGQYINEGILGPADQAARERAELERTLTSDKAGAVLQKQTAGLQAANQLLGQEAQNEQFSAQMGEQSRQFDVGTAENKRQFDAGIAEEEKNRKHQITMTNLENAFAEKGLKLQSILGYLQSQNFSGAQSAEIIKSMAGEIGFTLPDFTKATEATKTSTTANDIIAGATSWQNIKQGVNDPIYKELLNQNAGAAGYGDMKDIDPAGTRNDRHAYSNLESAFDDKTLINNNGKIYAVTDRKIIKKNYKNWTEYTLKEVGTGEEVKVTAKG